jgi:hypothetical protein
MRPGLAIALLLLAGCGQGGEGPRGGASANQIERLSSPEKEEVDPNAAARIAPLGPEDLAALGASSCDFSRGGRILLAATPSDAVARVAGVLRHFTHSSPMGPTGGFFEDRQISISVGRTGAVPPGEAAAGSWPGRIIVTNRRANADMRLDGAWRCGT